jgi:hypothetical protein
LTYWRDLRGDRSYPSPQEVTVAAHGHDPADVDLVTHFFVVDFDGEPMESVFTSGSSVLDTICGIETAGRRISECLPSALGNSMISFVRAMARARKPIAVSGAFDVEADAKVLYRSIYMPLSVDQAKVEHLLGAFSYKQQAAIV